MGIDDATGADHLEVHDREYFHPSEDEPVEFYVPVASVERELERLSSMTTAPPTAPPSEQANRTLRRWSAKYEWDAIYAEIACRCVDPKTRQVKVPKNESKLADAVLQWCVNTNRSAPGLTDMRDAVHAVCAALRKI